MKFDEMMFSSSFIKFPFFPDFFHRDCFSILLCDFFPQGLFPNLWAINHGCLLSRQSSLYLQTKINPKFFSSEITFHTWVCSLEVISQRACPYALGNLPTLKPFAKATTAAVSPPQQKNNMSEPVVCAHHASTKKMQFTRYCFSLAIFSEDFPEKVPCILWHLGALIYKAFCQGC